MTGAIAPVARGKVDFCSDLCARNRVSAIDAGEPVTLLAGVHVGCFELFAKEGIRSIAELKGKSIGVQAAGSLSATVGVPDGGPCRARSREGHPLGHRSRRSSRCELFVEGKIDAFLGFPPEPQDLRARRIGHVIVNTQRGPPWSQYFCCMIAGNRGLRPRYPVATKRVLRAILKATDLCATEPARVARQLVDGGFTATLRLCPADAERHPL